MSAWPLLDQARSVIAAALASHDRPAVMCSFGKDAMLLLHLVLEQVEDVPVIWLGHETTPDQFAFISRTAIERDLTLFKIAPAQRYVVQASNGQYSLIREYLINGESYPVVSDLVHSNKRCILDLDRLNSRNIEAPYDCIFTGLKEADRHPIFGDSPIPFPADGAEISGAKWYAPLRSLTDDDVWRATKDLFIPYNQPKYDEHRAGADPDNIIACSRCVIGHGSVFCHARGRDVEAPEWNRVSTRTEFLRNYFNV